MTIARRILALLLLAMAAGQLSDISGFVDIVATHEVGGRSAAWVLSVVLIAGELGAGVGLLVGGNRYPATTTAIVVAVVWGALAAQAFARGLVVPNCGCFGVHLGQELGWWVLLEDAEFLALALWVGHRAPRRLGVGSPSTEQVAGR